MDSLRIPSRSTPAVHAITALPHSTSPREERQAALPTPAPSSLPSSVQAAPQGLGEADTLQLQHTTEQLTRATQRAPQNAQYWALLAQCERLLGQTQAALGHARKAFDLDRHLGIACQLVTELLLEQQHPSEALDCLDRLDASVVREAWWHLARTRALLALNDLRGATKEAAKALTQAGANTDIQRQALLHLGQAHLRQQTPSEAAWCYRSLLELEPHALGAALRAVHCSAQAADWPAQSADLARLQTCLHDLQQGHPVKLPELLYPPWAWSMSANPALQRWLAELSSRQRWPRAVARVSGQARALPRRRGRWRLGLICDELPSPDSSLPVLALLEALLNTEAPSASASAFELVVYWSGATHATPQRQRAQQLAQQWHDTQHWHTAEHLQAIRHDQIGVLVDLNGWGPGSRLDVLAQRPAAVQVAWLGHHGTTGTDFVDYLIGDPVVTPLDDQPHFSECIAQMPLCHRALAAPQPSSLSGSEAPSTALVPVPSRSACGLPPTGSVLAAFHPPELLSAELFGLWCQVLAHAPQAVLWLAAAPLEVQQRLRQTARHHHIDPARLVFAPPQAHAAEHRARLRLADLVLDSFPAQTGTAASDALAAGVPVLTLAGDSFASRITASVLLALELPELVCRSTEDYLHKAVRWAQQSPDCAALRERLHQSCSAPTRIDVQPYARDFAQLVQRMVRRHEAGRLPAPMLGAAQAPATVSNPSTYSIQSTVSSLEPT